MSKNNEIIVVDEQTLQVNDTIRQAITAKHKFVSTIKTPKLS